MSRRARRREARRETGAAARPDTRSGTRSALLRGVLAGASAAVVGAVATSSAAAHLARRAVTVEPSRPDDATIVEVGEDVVVLRATPETSAPGRYGLEQDRGTVHARVGEIVDRDDEAGTVTRRLLGVDRGIPHPGGACWSQSYHHGDPMTALGLPFRTIGIPTEFGPMPAWLVPASGHVPSAGTWAILVHGRGGTREECLRALPVLHRLGMTSLVVSYRNDPGAPPSPRGRYLLGDAEWADVEDAVIHALRSGARDVVLLGWSMGGAMVLQLVARSWTADRVSAVVLDAPVLDWRHVLDHNARAQRIPVPLARLARRFLGHPLTSRIVGIDDPVSLDRLDWVARASELRLPLLLIHSEDDETVPVGPSRMLAEARPDLVTFVPSRGARHTKEWNVDPDGWETAVARFLLGL